MATPFELKNEYEAAYTQLKGAQFNLSSEFEAAYVVANNDLFINRYVLGDPVAVRDIPINLSSYTMQTGEPNPQVVTKTAWYEYQLGNPPDKVRFWVDGATSTGRVVVYRASTPELVEPTLDQLVAVGQGTDFWIDPLDDSYSSYFIQVGLKTGTGSDLVFHMQNGQAEAGSDFETAIEISGLWGSEYQDLTNANIQSGEPIPAGISPTASAWFLWECPDPAPDGQTFTVEATAQTGDIGIAVYTGTTLTGLTQVVADVSPATSSASVYWAPAANTQYYIQITTEYESYIHNLSWDADSDLLEPSTIPEGLVVRVYQPDGLTLISEVPKRLGSRFQESLNVIQSAELSVSVHDEVLKLYPALLNERNIVKFWLGNVCASGFRIQKSQLRWISNGEHSQVVKTVSGPTLNCLMSDFMVHHDVDPRPDSPDVRFYSWASRPDEWYNAAFWNHKIMASSQTNPPGHWSRPAKKRAKYGHPKKWPDKGSQWFWITNFASRNGGWKPPFNTLSRYYRREFGTVSDQRFSIFVTGDMTLVVYMDGEEIIRRSAGENGHKSFTRVDFFLRKGQHTLAVYGRASESVGGDGVDAFMLTMMKRDASGSLDGVFMRTSKGGAGWKAYYGPRPPTWNRAMVVRNTFREAIERNSTAALRLAENSSLTGIKFSKSHDSAGVRWTDVFNQEIRIGSSAYELVQQVAEGGTFDLWVHPDTLDVYAWRRRGVDKSKSVALIPGASLLDWETTTEDQVVNYFLIHFDGGWTKVTDPDSIRQFDRREMVVELNGVKSGAAAQSLMQQVLRGSRAAIIRAGTPDIVTRRIDQADSGGFVGVEGAYPFLDFNVGDVISAPGADIGSYKRMRVLGISCSEDAEGRLTFDPDLEQL